MKLQRLMSGLLGLAAIAALATNAQAAIYTTADAGGADAELRESQPTTARGTGTEIASRIADGSRNSVIYLKFGVQDITAGELAGDIKVRTTYRNNNLSASRFQWTANNASGLNTGFDYYVMDPTLAGADWDEATITPLTAPAYSFDGDFKTKATGTPASPTAGLTYLGSKMYDNAQFDPVVGHMLVGDNFILNTIPGSPLHNAIVAAQGTAHQTVTIAMVVSHEWDNPNGNWLNFNYLFNPKEQTTLNNDPPSPWSGADNSAGQFAPSLITVPEPTTVVLGGMASLGLLALRRRR